MITFTQVQKILIDQLGIVGDQITPASRLQEDLGVDSLDHVEIIMALEEEFDIDIDDEDAEKVSTVQDILDHLNACEGVTPTPC